LTLLIGGLLLFTVAHLFPAAFAGPRKQLVDKLGFNPYRGLFSLVIVASLLSIVFGWKAAPQTNVYTAALHGSPIVPALVFVAFVLFVASQSKTNIRRFVRHPQMAAVLFWSAAHLLANGETRSLILFGGLGIWAIAEILLCNRRDGAWEKPAPTSTSTDVITVVIATVAFALILYFHQALFGVPVWTE